MSEFLLYQIENSQTPAEIKEAILASFKYYPELSGANIEFRYSNIKTLMAARPRFDFLFRKKKSRRYVITINKDADKSEIISKMGFNARVGIIGHELGHIVDYMNKSNYEILKTGLGYLFKYFRTKLERKIDEITILHDLGVQLYEFTNFVYTEDCVDENYKRYKKSNYYSPADLIFLLRKKHGLLSSEFNTKRLGSNRKNRA